MTGPNREERLEAASGAATDQLNAVIRDLSPGAQVALVNRVLGAINAVAEHMEAHRLPHAADIGIAACIGGVALDHLAKTVPEDDPAARVALVELMNIMKTAQAGLR